MSPWLDARTPGQGEGPKGVERERERRQKRRWRDVDVGASATTKKHPLVEQEQLVVFVGQLCCDRHFSQKKQQKCCSDMSRPWLMPA